MEHNAFSEAKAELITRFSEPIQFLTRASVDKIVGMFSEPCIEGLEDYIKEKAHTYNLDLDEINSYTPYRSFYYGLARLARPNVVVETGVWYGASTAFILEALENNGKGELYSIDLPNTRYRTDNGSLIVDGVGMPENTGVLVPPNLRHRWHLILGKSQEKLTPLLKSLGEIDVFIHDGEHTYDAMMFEFQTAFEFLRCGGVLISDDVHDNGAFHDFVRQQRCSSFVFPRRQGEYMGAMVK
ncbi:MAG: class I SAM-dependent methyltransferase [Candidatus Bathyarchaeia archaeon]